VKQRPNRGELEDKIKNIQQFLNNYWTFRWNNELINVRYVCAETSIVVLSNGKTALIAFDEITHKLRCV